MSHGLSKSRTFEEITDVEQVLDNIRQTESKLGTSAGAGASDEPYPAGGDLPPASGGFRYLSSQEEGSYKEEEDNWLINQSRAAKLVAPLADYRLAAAADKDPSPEPEDQRREIEERIAEAHDQMLKFEMFPYTYFMPDYLKSEDQQELVHFLTEILGPRNSNRDFWIRGTHIPTMCWRNGDMHIQDDVESKSSGVSGLTKALKSVQFVDPGEQDSATVESEMDRDLDCYSIGESSLVSEFMLDTSDLMESLNREWLVATKKGRWKTLGPLFLRPLAQDRALMKTILSEMREKDVTEQMSCLLTSNELTSRFVRTLDLGTLKMKGSF
ncbi:phosphoprotein [Scophthalmus maximus rhabdovirus]|uniref:Phosphoprotein n=1 Tax=Scophthalmus maximus rhabdovirus TaxID=936149 RepID=E7D0U2_9RHAB|nr:phosphoprotein [Scophthalmus maximus rhabdovirus]ADU05402.1 phosphoprotein [Scophthalmus maximus rhabdovirus]